MATTPDYSINYDDERFTQVDAEKEQAITQSNNVYDGMIENSDKYFEDQIQASKDWADTQAQIQQDNTDFAIEQINQQKDQAHKDYLKEQSGAYVDWRKQSNEYGAEAEKMASAGLERTGYSESSQVSMYNTYQNRVATAREAYGRAVLNYDNAIKDAQLQNNAALAEIAYNALQQQLELSLQGFQYKNQLIIDKANKQLEIDNMYYSRYQDVLNQINTENAIKEDIRQFDANLEFQEKENQLDRDFQAEQNKIERDFKEKQAALDRKHDKEMLQAKTKAEKEMLELQHKKDMEKLEKQKQNQLAILDRELANEKALLKEQYSYKGTSGTGSTSGSKSGYTVKGSSKSGSTKKKTSGNAKVNSTTKKTTTTNSGGKTINMQSVLALGYGPISSSKLASLVNSGQVTMYTKGNQIYYKKVVTLPTSKRGGISGKF